MALFEICCHKCALKKSCAPQCPKFSFLLSPTTNDPLDSLTSMAPQLAANSLSTPSTNAIEATATLAYTPVQTPLDALPTIYDIPHTIAHLASLDPPAKNVALQFPDELLIDSVDVFRALQDGLDQIGKGGRAWVLADTTYGR